MIYAHDFLHVPLGPDAGCSYDGFLPRSQNSAARTKGGDDAMLALADQGYTILPKAATIETVDRARAYVSEHRPLWAAQARCRSDDWRMHYMQGMDGTCALNDGHAPIANLLCASQIIFDFVTNASQGRPPSGVFYTQVAYRTPVTVKTPPQRPYSYHLDGEANTIGSRFPDHFSLIVGIALSPQRRVGCGNFSVFPGAHLRDWAAYADLKRCALSVPAWGVDKMSFYRQRALPNLGPPTEVLLDVGDAVVAHPLLPHRGGRNLSVSTRETVFFRLQLEGIDYSAPERAAALLQDPFYELPGRVVCARKPATQLCPKKV